MAQEVPWDPEAEPFISDIDDAVSDKYKISFKGLLINPDKYLGKEGIVDTITSIKQDADSYFEDLLSKLQAERDKLVVDLENATSQYRQINSVIENKSAVSRVPYLKPFAINRDEAKEEVIVVDQYKDSMDALIGKLMLVSTYVADISVPYKEYYLGYWLFSGPKNYVLTINPPDSPVFLVEDTKELIDDMLDDIQSRAGE